MRLVTHRCIDRTCLSHCFSRLGYDYRHLMDEKRRIGYSGPGLSERANGRNFTFSTASNISVVPERTEVDEVLLKNIDVPFGIWLYKYVRLYVSSCVDLRFVVQLRI